MAAADFWSDRRQAESVGKTARVLKDIIADWETLDAQLEDLDQLRQMAVEEDDAEALAEVEAEVESAVQGIGELEFRTMLSDEADPKNAILVIHSGAGGHGRRRMGVDVDAPVHALERAPRHGMRGCGSAAS